MAGNECGQTWVTYEGPVRVWHVCRIVHDDIDEYHECSECGLIYYDDGK